mgnify:CR=1 FL=1
MPNATPTMPVVGEIAAQAELERKSLTFDIKAVSPDGSGSFEGIANAFFNIDDVGDITAKGAFEADLPSFLASGFIGAINHNWDNPIGHPSEARETDAGLFIKAVFDPSMDAQAVRAKMTPHTSTGRATVRFLSIGYKSESRRLQGLNECKAYWSSVGYTPTAQDLQRAENGARLLTRIKLIEVSPVVKPANTESRITGTKGSLETKHMPFADHSRLVVAALREAAEGSSAFVKRAESRVDARLKAGRELSASNWQALKELHDEHMSACETHKGLCERLKGILDRTAPPKNDEAEPAKPFEVDESAVLAAYVATMTATNPAR